MLTTTTLNIFKHASSPTLPEWRGLVVGINRERRGKGGGLPCTLVQFGPLLNLLPFFQQCFNNVRKFHFIELASSQRKYQICMMNSSSSSPNYEISRIFLQLCDDQLFTSLQQQFSRASLVSNSNSSCSSVTSHNSRSYTSALLTITITVIYDGTLLKSKRRGGGGSIDKSFPPSSMSHLSFTRYGFQHFIYIKINNEKKKINNTHKKIGRAIVVVIRHLST